MLQHGTGDASHAIMKGMMKTFACKCQNGAHCQYSLAASDGTQRRMGLRVCDVWSTNRSGGGSGWRQPHAARSKHSICAAGTRRLDLLDNHSPITFTTHSYRTHSHVFHLFTRSISPSNHLDSTTYDLNATHAQKSDSPSSNLPTTHPTAIHPTLQPSGAFF